MDARKEGLPRKPRFSAQHPQPRVGLGLLPFFLACAVYLLVQNSTDQPSWVSALLKILPILYLAGFLGTPASSGLKPSCTAWLPSAWPTCSTSGPSASRP